MTKWLIAASLAASSGFSIADNYLSREEVKSVITSRDWYLPVHNHFALGYVAVKRFRFHDGGRLEFAYLGQIASYEDLKWKVKRDGRLCIPDLKYVMKCRFVRQDGEYLQNFNKKGVLKYTFSPYGHGQ